VVVELLSSRRVAQLRADRWTYPDVGRTGGDLPTGYRTFRRTAILPLGGDFGAATRELFTWEVQRRAGLRVAASDERVEPDSVAILGFGVEPLAMRAPCRVVYVIDEPRRRGFAYGTLPGHPESGEEAFILEQRDDGTTALNIIAFSRPASILAKLAGPIGRIVQDAMTTRYLRALGA
jgi:uncharacterized protein (UPF0548 family)